MSVRQSQSSVDSRIIFKETFNSEESVRRNGGVPTDMTVENGKGVFNGTSSKILYPDFNHLHLGNFSIRIKFNYIDDGNFHYIFTNGATGGNNGWGVGVISSQLRAEIKPYTTRYTLVSNPGLSLNDENREIIFTCNRNGNIYMYVDSVQQNSVQNVSYQSTISLKTSWLPSVGSIFTSSYYTGKINLIEVYNDVLTAEEVALLYTNNLYVKPKFQNEILSINPLKGVLEDKYGNSITNTAVTLVKDKEYVMKFNGGTSRLNLGTFNDLTGNISIITWVKAWTFGDSTNGYILTNEKLIFRIGGASIFYLYSNGSNFAFSSVVNLLNNWVCIIITRDSIGTVNFYINDILSNASISSGIPAISSSNIIIGNRNAIDRSWNGLIGEIQVIERLLAAEEISQYYNATKNYYIG